MVIINIKKEHYKPIVVGILGWLLAFSLGSCRRINVGVEERVYVNLPSDERVFHTPYGPDTGIMRDLDTEIMRDLAKDVKEIINSMPEKFKVRKRSTFNYRKKSVLGAGLLLFGGAILAGGSGYAMYQQPQDNFSVGMHLNNIETALRANFSALDEGYGIFPHVESSYVEVDDHKCVCVQSLLTELQQIGSSRKLGELYNSCSVNTRFFYLNYIPSLLQFCYEQGYNPTVAFTQNMFAKLRNICDNAILLFKSSSSAAEEMVGLHTQAALNNIGQLDKCNFVQSRVLRVENTYGGKISWINNDERDLSVYLPNPSCPFSSIPERFIHARQIPSLLEFCYKQMYQAIIELSGDRWREEQAICIRAVHQLHDAAQQSRTHASFSFPIFHMLSLMGVAMSGVGFTLGAKYGFKRSSVQQEVEECCACMSEDNKSMQVLCKNLEQLYEILLSITRAYVLKAPMCPELPGIKEKLDQLSRKIGEMVGRSPNNFPYPLQSTLRKCDRFIKDTVKKVQEYV